MNRKMNKKIYQISRYGQPRHITDLGDGKYIIEGETKFYRVGGKEIINYVDFTGGPFIGVDGQLFHDDSTIIVESIKVEKTDKENYLKILITTHKT